jgi:uncharacterized coiled-coil protein SlyX
LLGCAKSEDRIATLEARIAELETKLSETDKAVAPLAKLPQEHKAIGDRVTLLQTSDVQTAETLAVLQKDFASMQEKLAILETPGTMSVETGAKTSTGPIGIAECDAYITKYEKCIRAKVPEAARESMLDAMAQSKKAWKEAASGPARENLAAACKAALDAAEAATKAMGCEW